MKHIKRTITYLSHPTVNITLVSSLIILLAPVLLPLQFPCLHSSYAPTRSYALHQCLASTITDRLLFTCLIIMATAGLLTYRFSPSNKNLHLLFTCSWLACLSIATYYWQLPQIISSTHQIPIILTPDSLLHP